MGLFSGIASIFGGGAAKKASRKAEAAQVEYLGKAIAEQQRQFDVTRADYQPYLTAGLGGLGDLADLIGINGADAQSAGLVNIQNSPELAALIRNGEEAVLQNASATGGLRGGNIQTSLANFRADTFANQLQTQIARLAGLAGLGQGATDSVSSFGANSSNNISDLLATTGAAKAGQILTRGGINSSIWGNIGSSLDSFGKAASGMSGAPSWLSKLGSMF